MVFGCWWSALHLQGCVHVQLAWWRTDAIQMHVEQCRSHNSSNVIGLSTLTSADVAVLSFSPRRGSFRPARSGFMSCLPTGSRIFCGGSRRFSLGAAVTALKRRALPSQVWPQCPGPSDSTADRPLLKPPRTRRRCPARARFSFWSSPDQVMSAPKSKGGPPKRTRTAARRPAADQNKIKSDKATLWGAI